MNREIGRPRGASTHDELLAHNQINAVLAAYCQGVDRKDWDLVLSCYHENAIDDHSQFRGTPREFIEWIEPNHRSVATSLHFISNVSIGLSAEDPRLARVESYFLSSKTVTAAQDDTFFGSPTSGELLRRTVAGRYIDTFEQRESVGWRIARRDVVLEWVRKEANENYLPLESGMSRAYRDETDPLYTPFSPCPR